MFTTDKNDPELGHGIDTEKIEQHKKYLILSEEERSKGFVRPVRTSYVHVGLRPANPLRPLTEDEKKRFDYQDKKDDFVAYETYPEGSHALGRLWTQEDLDNKGCGTLTTMSLPLAETYARDPGFYYATYCCGCKKHLKVDEFIWAGTDEIVGS